MPIIVRRSDNQIIESNLTSPADMKGSYEIAHPSSLGIIPISSSSYVYPRDNGNVIKSVIEPSFLSTYPSYQGVIYNPLLDSADMTFDSTKTFPDPNEPNPTRYITGDTPNVFGVAKRNDTKGYMLRGFAISDEIDIGALTGGAGAQTFLVYWKAVTRAFSLDRTETPNTTSFNTPATLTYTEADPSLLKVYISINNGVSYEEVSNLTPISVSQSTTSLRIAFTNESTEDVTILSYAIMY